MVSATEELDFSSYFLFNFIFNVNSHVQPVTTILDSAF